VIRWAVERPAVVWSATAAVLIAGGVAFTKLPLATRPAVELPRLQVASSWPGASAELVEAFLTAPLEAAAQTVRGVRRVDSESDEGGAQLTITLHAVANVRLVRLALLERLDLLRDDLPAGASRPTVSNYVPQELAEEPLLQYTMAGPYTPGALARIARDEVTPRLSAIPGVAGVTRQDWAETGVAIAYDAARLRQLGLRPEAITDALARARIVQAVGEVEAAGGASVVPITLLDQPRVLEDVARLPVAAPSGRSFRLGELATARATEDTRGRFYRVDGRPAVALTIARQPGGDAIRTAAAVRREMAAIRPALPPGVEVRLQSDESENLRRQLRDPAIRIAIAFAGVVLVLAVGLRRVRWVALVALSALVAIAGAALGLYLLGVSANLLTIAGLGMGIGILVQNGIVVADRLERAPGDADHRAAAAAAITPAIMGSTLTTAVVLLPFLFLQGNARAAFVPFAVAFALALGWSILSSVVMLPAVATSAAMAPRWPRASRAYGHFVVRLLRWRLAAVALLPVGVGVAVWGFVVKVPRWSWGGWWGERSYLSASITFPRGSDPQSLDLAMREFESIVVGRAGVDQVKAQGSRDGAFLRVTFTPDAMYEPYVLEEELTRRAVLIGGAAVGVRYQGPGFFSGGGGGAISQRIKLLGYSYEGLLGIALDLKARLERIPRVRDVDINAGSFWRRERAFEIALRPDRAALARHGLTAADLARAVGREVAGPVGGQQLVLGDEEVRVSVKAAGAPERTLDELRGALLQTAAGGSVRIGDVAFVGEREVLSRISRQDQQYVRILSYEFRGPARLAQRTHQAFMRSISLPPGYSATDEFFGWQADDSAKGLWLVFAIGIVLVVLAVAIVFDSVWATVMVFLGLPIALAGSAAAFWIGGVAFNREAAVGVVLVVGLAVHQVILIVDAALRRRRGEGRTLRPLTAAAVVGACRDRVRMIVLVTLTTLASLIPLAVGTDADQLFGAIALATLGGTVAGTLGALVFVPALLPRFAVPRLRWYRPWPW